MEIPEPLVAALKEERCVGFIGAGLSKRAGLPSWPELLRNLIEAMKSHGLSDEHAAELTSHLKNPDEYLMVAQALDDLYRAAFRDELSQAFPEDVSPAVAHVKVIKLPFRLLITTNYDKLLESAYVQEIKQAYTTLTFEKAGQIVTRFYQNRYFILKAHGSVDDPSGMIITERDYRNLIYRQPGYRSALETIFNSRCLLFLGVSLRDPELKLLLSFLHDAFGGERPPQHYALVSDRDFSKAAQDHWRNHFLINCLPYTPSSDDHPEVDTFLDELIAEVGA